MKAFLSFFLSLFVSLFTSFKTILPISKHVPTPTPTIDAPTPTPAIALPITSTPAPIITPKPTVAPKPTVTIKTPSVTLRTGDYAYVVTIRPGEVVRFTTVRSQAGHRILHVIEQPSGAPSGVSWSTAYESDSVVNVFLHVDKSAQPGTYEWNQSEDIAFEGGGDNAPIAPTIHLVILPSN